jgi:amidase
VPLSQKQYQELDAIALAERVRAGEVQPRELLETAIARAAQVNGEINAICHPMYEAAFDDPNLSTPRGPLSGVPFLLKDLTAHAAGWPLTSGSGLLRDFVSSFDSTLVRRYREAGLVLFGRTHSPEFGYAAASESKLFGATRNPWNLALTSGGSSGGSAAAVAAGIVPAAQGGDGGGSIRIPASFCGLFGLKPTRARTPAGPAHGSFLSFAQTHVISRSVRDSALLLDLTQGPDTGAPYYAERPSRPYLEAVRTRPERLRIALQRRAYDDTSVAPDCIRALEDAAQLCEQLGHDVVEVNFRFEHHKLKQLYRIIWPMLILRALDMNSERTGQPWRAEDLEDYLAWNIGNVRSLSANDFLAALENVIAVGQEFAKQSDDFDVVLSPTTAQPAPRVGVLDPSNPDRDQLEEALNASTAFTQIYNVSGAPAASVPLYWTDADVPIGVQIGARYGDETTIFKLSGQLEAARPWARRRPSLMPV